jgi:hypothetical protein
VAVVAEAVVVAAAAQREAPAVAVAAVEPSSNKPTQSA